MTVSSVDLARAIVIVRDGQPLSMHLLGMPCLELCRPSARRGSPAMGDICRTGQCRGRPVPKPSVISLLDLIEIGILSSEEAKELHAMETSGAASTP
jgi:hypothetical protein